MTVADGPENAQAPERIVESRGGFGADYTLDAKRGFELMKAQHGIRSVIELS